MLFISIVITHPHSALGHGDVMRIGSTQPGGGQIVVEAEFEFATDVFYIPLAAQAGGSTLYSEVFPSFAWILEAANGFHPLHEEVDVDFTIAAPISAGASVRLAGRNLDAPGEDAAVGAFENDPESHVHPEWRLLLPNGVTGEYQVSFRLSADGFADSPVYTLMISNEEPAATPTATATSDVAQPTATPTATQEATATATPSATVTPPLCPGDCDGNGAVSIAELIRAVGLAGRGGTEGCAAADGNGDGSIAINELIRAVNAALEGCAAS